MAGAAHRVLLPQETGEICKSWRKGTGVKKETDRGGLCAKVRMRIFEGRRDGAQPDDGPGAPGARPRERVGDTFAYEFGSLV